MNKTDCYKCDREPSVHCGECPVWLADEAVSEKERIAYRQGFKDGVKKGMIEKLNSRLVYSFDAYSCIPRIARPSNSEIVDKINEIIDVVNSLEVVPDILRKDMVLFARKHIKEETTSRSCSECKQIDTCKDKIDARTIDDDIRYGMVVPNYILGPNAECLVAERNEDENRFE